VHVSISYTHIYHAISKNTTLTLFIILLSNSYRIEHIFDEKILEISESIRQYMLYKRLIHAIYFHRRAIELVLIWYIFLVLVTFLHYFL